MTEDQQLDQNLEEAFKKKKLDPKDYWEWRASIEELEKVKFKVENAKLLHLMDTLKIELTKHVAAESKRRFQEEAIMAKKVEDDYRVFLSQLEEKIGFELKDKIINPVTYEVLEDQNLKQKE